jgi:hypothetical protein
LICTLAAIEIAVRRAGPNAVYPFSSIFSRLFNIASELSKIFFFITLPALAEASATISSNLSNLSPAMTN